MRNQGPSFLSPLAAGGFLQTSLMASAVLTLSGRRKEVAAGEMKAGAGRFSGRPYDPSQKRRAF